LTLSIHESVYSRRMVHFFSEIDPLNAALRQMTAQYTSVFVLVDENTQHLCLNLIQPALPSLKIISISSGEQHKSLDTCGQIWSLLTAYEADRKALLINLGGGVITDMGGFAASCYKRGIDFINIPTTLLAMVDAAVGGKTGIDYEGFKNQIGLFREAREILICPVFLQTLGHRQLRSGLAEMIKHYLIADGGAFYQFGQSPIAPDLDAIRRAIDIKSSIVALDPEEKNIRKKLNFGHTVGHALESFRLQTTQPLLHGEAVAYGMAVEALIAQRLSLLESGKAKQVVEKIAAIFDLRPLTPEDMDGIMRFIPHDKKSESGKIRMALIDDIGSCKIDIEVSGGDVKNVISDFNKIMEIYAP
jgi:3-dehydroquinate synthase